MTKLDVRLNAVDVVQRALKMFFGDVEFEDCVPADYQQGYRDCASDIIFVLEGVLESQRGGEDGN